MFFITYYSVTSKAQVLLPTTEDREEKIKAHQDKLDFLKIIKTEIELKQTRVRQDTIAGAGLQSSPDTKSIIRKPKAKGVESKKEEDAPQVPK